MADTKPTGQAPTDAGTVLSTPPAAGAPADGAKPADGTPPAGTPPADTGAGKPASEPAGKDGQAPPAPKAPEKYELVVPKGAETFVDAKDLEDWAKVARENDWTQEEAQAALEAQADNVGAQLTRFRAETEADATYGKDHFEANQQLARRVIDRVRPKGHARGESFSRFLEKTGAGNHIEMFAFLADLGKLMAEDKPPTGGSADGVRAPRDAASVLYGGQ